MQQILLQDPSWAGGICHYTYSLCQGLSQAGARVTLLTSETYELESFERQFALVKLFHNRSTLPGRTIRSRVLRRLPRSAMFMVNASNMLRAIRDREVRVFHAQGVLDERFEPMLWRRFQRSEIPVVMTVHDVFPHETSSVDLDRLGRLYTAADHLIVHSQRARETLLEGWRIPRDRITVIPLGNYTAIADHWRADAYRCREYLNLPHSAPVVLFFGFLRDYKGLDVLIEAFASVRAKIEEAHLVVAGGHWGFRWEESVYAGLVEKHELENAIRVRSEYVPLDMVSTYFAVADVVALPYRRGSGSAVIQLAYAFGKPVVATDTGSFSETVDQGLTGLLVPPDDAQALGEALTRILSDRTQATKMGCAAREMAERRYNWNTIARQTIRVYERLLETL